MDCTDVTAQASGSEVERSQNRLMDEWLVSGFPWQYLFLKYLVGFQSSIFLKISCFLLHNQLSCLDISQRLLIFSFSDLDPKKMKLVLNETNTISFFSGRVSYHVMYGQGFIPQSYKSPPAKF